MSPDLISLLKDQFACCVKILNLVSDDEKVEAVIHIGTALEGFHPICGVKLIKEESLTVPLDLELGCGTEYFEKHVKQENILEAEDIKPDVNELLVQDGEDLNSVNYFNVEEPLHQGVDKIEQDHENKLNELFRIARNCGIDESLIEEVLSSSYGNSSVKQLKLNEDKDKTGRACDDLEQVSEDELTVETEEDTESKEAAISQEVMKEKTSAPVGNEKIETFETQLMSHACVICHKADYSGLISQRLSQIKSHYCLHFRRNILHIFKNKIRDSICLVNGCGRAISDSNEDARPNLARHIGSAHNKIYEILKQKGHTLEFLKVKAVKVPIAEARGRIGVKVRTKMKK